MENQINDLDQLKEMWSDLNRRVERLENQTIEEGRKVTSGKITTAREDLATRYKRFMIIGFVMGVFFPLFLILSPTDFFPDGTMKYVASAPFFSYFITAAVMDSYLYNEVRSMDLAMMTVSQVIHKARTLKRRHHIFMIILIPFAVITLAVFAIPLLDDPFIIAGMITGGGVGLCIGLRQYFRMMRDYRDMMREYSE